MANFWFKFDWDDWLNDEALSGCSLEAQGLWLRCICFMYRGDVAELKGTVEQLRRKLGVLPEELTRCLSELKTNGAADVRFGNSDVSIISRRRQRECKHKENNRLYVSRHREKADSKKDVSIQSKSKSKSKSNKEERKEVAASPPSNPEVEIWNAGKRLLSRSNLNVTQAGAFLGSMAKTYGKTELAQAISSTLANNPADPKSYLVAVLQKRFKAHSTVGKEDPDYVFVPDPPCVVCGKEVCFSLHRDELGI